MVEADGVGVRRCRALSLAKRSRCFGGWGSRRTLTHRTAPNHDRPSRVPSGIDRSSVDLRSWWWPDRDRRARAWSIDLDLEIDVSGRPFGPWRGGWRVGRRFRLELDGAKPPPSREDAILPAKSSRVLPSPPRLAFLFACLFVKFAVSVVKCMRLRELHPLPARPHTRAAPHRSIHHPNPTFGAGVGFARAGSASARRFVFMVVAFGHVHLSSVPPIPRGLPAPAHTPIHPSPKPSAPPAAPRPRTQLPEPQAPPPLVRAAWLAWLKPQGGSPVHRTRPKPATDARPSTPPTHPTHRHARRPPAPPRRPRQHARPHERTPPAVVAFSAARRPACLWPPLAAAAAVPPCTP